MRRNELLAAGQRGDTMFDYANAVAQADMLVIAAPYWDMSFPSSLKIFFEAASVEGITFTYADDGTPIGLCAAEDMYYVTTSGGYIGDCNFGLSMPMPCAGFTVCRTRILSVRRGLTSTVRMCRRSWRRHAVGRYFMLDKKEAAIRELAPKIWKLSRDRLLVNLRFLDAALSGLAFQLQAQSGQVCCDLSAPQRAVVYYDPAVVVQLYKKILPMSRGCICIFYCIVFSAMLINMTRLSRSCGMWRQIWRWRTQHSA